MVDSKYYPESVGMDCKKMDDGDTVGASNNTIPRLRLALTQHTASN